MDISAPYIAGIFDGEGTVGIYTYKGAPSPVLAIAGNYLPMLEALKQHFGFGMVFTMDVSGKTADGFRRNPTQGRYQLRRWEEIAAFLAEVRPHLMEKAEQADVFMAAFAARPGRGRSHTDQSRQAMENYAMALRTLKKPHAHANPV